MNVKIKSINIVLIFNSCGQFWQKIKQTEGLLADNQRCISLFQWLRGKMWPSDQFMVAYGARDGHFYNKGNNYTGFKPQQLAVCGNTETALCSLN